MGIYVNYFTECQIFYVELREKYIVKRVMSNLVAICETGQTKLNEKAYRWKHNRSQSGKHLHDVLLIHNDVMTTFRLCFSLSN